MSVPGKKTQNPGCVVNELTKRHTCLYLFCTKTINRCTKCFGFFPGTKDPILQLVPTLEILNCGFVVAEINLARHAISTPRTTDSFADSFLKPDELELLACIQLSEISEFLKQQFQVDDNSLATTSNMLDFIDHVQSYV